MHLTLERLGHVAPVEQAGHRVADDLIPQHLLQPQIAERQRDVVGHSGRQAPSKLSPAVQPAGGAPPVRLISQVQDPHRRALGDQGKAQITGGGRGPEMRAEQGRFRRADHMGAAAA